MRRIRLMVAVLSAMLPALAQAQGTDVDNGTDIRARVSAELDRKISKGFHVYGGFEGRFKDNVGNVNDFRLFVGTSYKIAPWLKAQAGYTLIDNHTSAGAWKLRHRVQADLTASCKAGDWRFSLRERLQMTHFSGDFNPYQQTRNSVALKSRFKVSWKPSKTWEPYGYVEIRNTFNDPSFTATYNTSRSTYSNVVFNGYNDVYINRYRGSLGVDWSVTKRHTFDFYVLFDRYRDKDIDTNREGSESWEESGLVLKSLTYRTGTNISFGVAYRYSF